MCWGRRVSPLWPLSFPEDVAASGTSNPHRQDNPPQSGLKDQLWLSTEYMQAAEKNYKYENQNEETYKHANQLRPL